MEALASFEPITPPLVGMPAASTAPKKQSEGSTATIIVAVCVTAAVMFVIAVQLYVLWRSAGHAVAAPRAHGSGAGMSRRGQSQGLKKDEIGEPQAKPAPNNGSHGISCVPDHQVGAEHGFRRRPRERQQQQRNDAAG